MNRSVVWPRRIAAIAIAGVMLIPLAACSGGSGGGDKGAANASKLTLGLESDPAPQGYDPVHYAGGAQDQFYSGLYDSLFTYDKDGKVVPSLVSDFSYNADSTTLTLDLKPDVTFTDGGTLDAALVKANLDRRDQPGFAAYNAIKKGGATEIASVDVVDDDTVALTFSKPQAGFQVNLVGTPGMIVGPDAVKNPDSLAAKPDGSGPYTLDSGDTVKSNSYALTKKKDSPEASAYPFDSIVFKVMLDPQARLNALISGQIDSALLAAATVDTAKKRKVALSQIGGTVYEQLIFDKLGATAPAFANVKVRQALSIAIDRKAFVNALHKGELPTWNALPKDSPGFDPKLESEFAYNPKKAKQLLAEAGYPDGFSFTRVVGDDTKTDAQAIQKYYAAIGVDMQLKVATSTEEAFNSVKTTPMGGPQATNWANPVAVMNGVVFGFTNFQGAKNPELSAATGALAAAQTDADRAKALTDLNRHLVEDVWLMPLYEQLTTHAYNATKLKKVTFAGTNSWPLLSSYTPAG
ncbi:ABC transporter substrate-binding protein [Microbacterium sp. STN6]|uniref:ABC transporter substrate-binding protein n=1 Tax=Microbacterium sp. STN6 TaxID=2995588 RepID=UPI0022609CB8|nr:ABC transporter substrate-binding protein [Microbacterium sp. STN6]MCX7520760.1 ABC transporter substrate-binding protein [Microbacterium sp. STN6]